MPSMTVSTPPVPNQAVTREETLATRRILFAGHEEGRAVHKPEVGALSRRQSLTGFRETLRVLVKMALADERFDGRIFDLGRRRKAGCRDRIGDRNHAAPSRKRRPVP